jgi:hypothetical protein
MRILFSSVTQRLVGTATTERSSQLSQSRHSMKPNISNRRFITT